VPSTTTTTAPTTTTLAPTTTTTPGTSASGTRTATGKLTNYGYGEIAIAVTASGSQITNVAVASLVGDENFRSQSIDEQSIPVLEQEAMQAQGANIATVTGATYTSEGFISSLQSALQQLGL
jgi:uncharacterized protein with FMN-binding domain